MKCLKGLKCFNGYKGFKSFKEFAGFEKFEGFQMFQEFTSSTTLFIVIASGHCERSEATLFIFSLLTIH